MISYIITGAVLLIFIAIVYAKIKKSKVDVGAMKENLLAFLDIAFNDFAERVAEKNNLTVRDIYLIEKNSIEDEVNSFKVFQSYAWMRCFLFMKTMLTIANIGIVKGDKYKLLFLLLKDEIKERLPDFSLDAVGINSSIKYEFEGYIEDIFDANYTDEQTAEMLKDAIANYLGVSDDKISDFDEQYDLLVTELREIAWSSHS